MIEIGKNLTFTICCIGVIGTICFIVSGCPKVLETSAIEDTTAIDAGMEQLAEPITRKVIWVNPNKQKNESR